MNTKEHTTYQKSISDFENGLSESFRICIREFWNSSLKTQKVWEYSQTLHRLLSISLTIYSHRYNIECVWVLAICSDLYWTFAWQKVDKKSPFVTFESICIKPLKPKRVRQHRLINYNSNVPNKPQSFGFLSFERYLIVLSRQSPRGRKIIIVTSRLSFNLKEVKKRVPPQLLN